MKYVFTAVFTDGKTATTTLDGWSAETLGDQLVTEARKNPKIEFAILADPDGDEPRSRFLKIR